MYTAISCSILLLIIFKLSYTRVLNYNFCIMAEEATPKSAQKVYTLEDIKFNEANKTMAILACIPIIGLVLLFTEKDDKFVRYNGAQAVLVSLGYVVAWFPVIGWLLGLAIAVALIIMFVKALSGQRFDIPVVSGLALKLIAKI